jgi:chemotaxis protein MotB
MKKKHPEHVNHERWLVSYADFITLLFAFFVVLFASGQSDKRKQIKLAEAMQTAFAHNGIFDPHARTPPITDAMSPAQNAAPAAIALPIPVPIDQVGQGEGQGGEHSGAASVAGTGKSTAPTVATVQKAIQDVITMQVAKHQLEAGGIDVHPSPDGLVISLREAGFFASGSADVRPGALEVLHEVAAALPHQSIRVEGHTDDVPIHTGQFATNWELSTARAATITRLLIADNAVDPAQVCAAGYAEFHPTASNNTLDGRAKNRRVDIILLNH